MNFNKKLITILGIALLATGTWSCKKDSEVPEDKVDLSNAYRNATDADAAVIGIYGQFLGLHKSFILHNELRADLMNVTNNADPYLRQLANHTTTKENPYIDPRPYYNVILNCNDALRNFTLMRDDFRMSVDEYNKHYSDIGALRSYIYLQLGVQYGSIPYITEPLENVEDVKNIGSHPRISFDQLLDKLLEFTEKLPYKEVYSYPTGHPLIVTIDGNFTERMFISKLALLGDLYLWKDNYIKAAETYLKIFNFENTNTRIEKGFSWYKVTYDAYNYADATVRYGRSQDESTLLYDVGWRSMFALPTTSLASQAEYLWLMPYNSNFKPGNPMFDLCSDQYGKYLVKPSQTAIDNWNAQRQNNGIPYDARGRLSYSVTNNGPVITKLTATTELPSIFNKNGNWGIYRATLLHLRYAEAANRDGKSKLGYALINNGVLNTFYSGTRNAAGQPAPVSFDDIASMRTPYAAPFFLDASSNSDFRGPWYRNYGIRGRAGLSLLDISYQTDLEGMESKIIDEGALEMAFEGNRWPDLVRIAKRKNDPSFLAERVYQKLLKDGDPSAAATRAKLMNPANWYLPFDWSK